MTKKNEVNEVSTLGENMLSQQNQTPMGFENEDDGDLIIPRIKVVQTLSPERKEKLAEEGDIINSLTKTKLNGKVFVPVFKITSNIYWKDRSDGGGMQCQSRDGKIGQCSDGTSKMCKVCKLNEFDNTQTGKAALPKCTKYINFFGFIQGKHIPIILSFAKTNYNEGRKLYSLAKVTMQNMWNHGYALTEKKVAKAGNEWFIIDTTPVGKTTDEDRAYGMQLFNAFRNADIKYDIEDNTDSEASVATTNVEGTEF